MVVSRSFITDMRTTFARFRRLQTLRLGFVYSSNLACSTVGSNSHEAANFRNNLNTSLVTLLKLIDQPAGTNVLCHVAVQAAGCFASQAIVTRRDD